jgi:hypothetical protein
MIRKLFGIAVLSLVSSFLLSLSSCAHSQQLVGITVSPQASTVTLSGVGQVVGTQFTAYGTYIHPPETRDLTGVAVWTTDSPTVIQIDPSTPGLVNTTGYGCGTNLGITATVHTSSNQSGNIVVGTSSMNVSFGTGVTCP